MRYTVRRTVTNGYRCGCCHQSWRSDSEHDDLAEALEKCPTTFYPGNGDQDIEDVEVTDNETGEVIAEASMSGTRGYWQYSGYEYTRWKGYTPDGEFDLVLKGQSCRSDPLGRAWADVLAEMGQRKEEKERKDAEKALADAQARVDRLTP